MNIVLIYGGRSGEHEISLISCAAVARNVAPAHSVKLIGVTKEGKWYLQDDSVLVNLRADKNAKLTITADEKNAVSVIPGGGANGAFGANGKVINADCVFPVMHGTYSEDGTIQGLLDMASLCYVGCNVLSSAITMDKVTTKIMWEQAGLPVVPYMLLTRSDINDSKTYDAKVALAVKKLHFPLFVKPCSAGSSDGASKATNAKELSMALMEAFQWDDKVLIEKAINAREVECAVTGNSICVDNSDKCTIINTYGPGEIVPKHIFYDYDAKYNDPNGAELKIPALLNEKKLTYIRETAKEAYRAVDASGLSRVDFFIDRKNGKIDLNEINTIPGFTSISMFPKMCEATGLDFTALLELLFSEATARFYERNLLCTSR